MRVKRGELLSKLYVFRALNPYESEQWSVFSDTVGACCVAQVRASGDGEEIEADIMVVYDEPRPHMPIAVQIMWMKAKLQKTGEFLVTECRIKDKDKVNSVFEWGQKSCKFFMLCTQQLEKGELPRFDELLDVAFKDDGQWSDMWGDGGGKSPKFKSEMMMKTGAAGF